MYKDVWQWKGVKKNKSNILNDSCTRILWRIVLDNGWLWTRDSGHRYLLDSAWDDPIDNDDDDFDVSNYYDVDDDYYDDDGDYKDDVYSNEMISGVNSDSDSN